MERLKEQDGAYYAIKGFEFQIDKTILEIFNCDLETEKVKIEQIQDIETNNFIMQVKYRETQDFSSAKIKEPVMQLLREFRSDNNKIYYLYAYFKKIPQSFTSPDKKIDLEKLENILGDRKDDFTLQEKKSFINSFRLDFAPTFQEQFEKVILKLKEQRFVGNSDDEAIFYYSNIADLLRKIVVNNTARGNRYCTRRQILDYIENGKKIIFNSAFKDYKGDREYLKFIKSKFIKPKKDQENFIFIGNVEIEKTTSVSKLIMDIVDRHYDKALFDIRPLVFVVHGSILGHIKKDFIKKGLIFNDGYEHIAFSEDIFFQDPIKNRKRAGNGRATDSLSRISFKVRLLSIEVFGGMSELKIHPKLIYYFDCDILDSLKSFPFIKIDKLNTEQINKIFIF